MCSAFTFAIGGCFLNRFTVDTAFIESDFDRISTTQSFGAFTDGCFSVSLISVDLNSRGTAGLAGVEDDAATNDIGVGAELIVASNFLRFAAGSASSSSTRTVGTATDGDARVEAGGGGGTAETDTALGVIEEAVGRLAGSFVGSISGLEGGDFSLHERQTTNKRGA
jgi:hypothetical protein